MCAPPMSILIKRTPLYSPLAFCVRCIRVVKEIHVTQALAEMTETYSLQRSAEVFIAAVEASLGGAKARGRWKGRR